MTAVCATSEDLAAVKKLIVAAEARASEGHRQLEARINDLSDRLASDDPVIRPCAASVRVPGTTPWIYTVDLDSVMADGLSSFIRARNKGWGEQITPEEAILRMIREGLRSTQRGLVG